jgi:hypothetical protein
MRTLCNKIPEERRNKLFASYGSEIEGCCVFPVGRSFFEWLTGDLDYFEHQGLDVSEMSNITHTLYMGMCDYLGPVEADNVLNHAASAVANQYPNAELDINNLL